MQKATEVQEALEHIEANQLTICWIVAMDLRGCLSIMKEYINNCKCQWLYGRYTSKDHDLNPTVYKRQ